MHPSMGEGVCRGYDDTASAYAEAFADELAGKPYDRLILDRFGELTAGGVVCEIGSGPAQVSSYLATREKPRRPSRVIALDISGAMLRQARRLVPGIAAVQADMAKLPFPDHRLDGLFAFYAIVHLEIDELGPVFAEWMRVLKPGGWLLLTFHCGSERIHLDEFLGNRVDMEWVFADPDTVLALLDQLAFRRDACIVRYPYPGVEHASKRAYFLVQRPDHSEGT